MFILFFFKIFLLLSYFINYNVVGGLSKQSFSLRNKIIPQRINKNFFNSIKNNKISNQYLRRNNYSFIHFKKKRLPHLLCFHSKDCEYCNSMEKLLKKLKEEENIKFLKLEMYENTYNFELLQQLDYNNLCGGLPYYYNLKTHYNICGATTYKNLRNWALDKKCNPNEPPNDEI
ncbi:conserved Plasmodium protein, unknown function [Plasmodium relictum]|uniref:Thioredoxin-like protein n=1 Tax=Plasmodium relictum TaxID=85471 RepID=A0A1J1H9V2_PLARL|nr:conserved Plasmodium protein, unknown function [Plasmodium relictum]CRH00375.1 conserved Plasmodium protein, unknown function [Plasmodium relictum]